MKLLGLETKTATSCIILKMGDSPSMESLLDASESKFVYTENFHRNPTVMHINGSSAVYIFTYVCVWRKQLSNNEPVADT